MTSRGLSFALVFTVACGGGSGTGETGTSTGDVGTGTGVGPGGTGTTHDETTSVPTTGQLGSSGETSSTSSTSTTSSSSSSTTGDDTTGTTTGGAQAPASLDDVVDGALELIADGHMFTEGPVWSQAGGYLLYSDIPADTIFKWTEGEGSAVFIMPSGNSNGLTFDGMGRLLSAEHGGRRIARRVLEQQPTAVADQYMGKKLNSPNDVVVRSDGTVYFTDPPYGIQPADQEQPFQGVFRVDLQGVVSVIADDFDRPNGLVLAPDESLLYVDDTAKEHVRVFDVMADGSAVGGDVFVDLKSDAVGDPDGMTVDEFGDLYVTGGGGVRVVTPDGVVLGTIAVPESATNCTFGDADGHALFVTAPPRVYRQRLKVAGAGM